MDDILGAVSSFLECRASPAGDDEVAEVDVERPAPDGQVADVAGLDVPGEGEDDLVAAVVPPEGRGGVLPDPGRHQDSPAGGAALEARPEKGVGAGPVVDEILGQQHSTLWKGGKTIFPFFKKKTRQLYFPPFFSRGLARTSFRHSESVNQSRHQARMCALSP